MNFTILVWLMGIGSLVLLAVASALAMERREHILAHPRTPANAFVEINR